MYDLLDLNKLLKESVERVQQADKVETMTETAMMRAVIEGSVVVAKPGMVALVVTGAHAGGLVLTVVQAVVQVVEVALALKLTLGWMVEKLSSWQIVWYMSL